MKKVEKKLKDQDPCHTDDFRNAFDVHSRVCKRQPLSSKCLQKQRKRGCFLYESCYKIAKKGASGA